MEFDVSFDGDFPKWTYTSLYVTDFQFTVIYSFCDHRTFSYYIYNLVKFLFTPLNWGHRADYIAV